MRGVRGSECNRRCKPLLRFYVFEYSCRCVRIINYINMIQSRYIVKQQSSIGLFLVVMGFSHCLIVELFVIMGRHCWRQYFSCETQQNKVFISLGYDFGFYIATSLKASRAEQRQQNIPLCILIYFDISSMICRCMKMLPFSSCRWQQVLS